MYTMKVKVLLTRVNNNAYNLIGEVNRLSSCNKQFSFRFGYGKKVYLETCKGLIENAFLSVKDRKLTAKKISLLNYAVSIQTPLNVSFEYKNNTAIVIFEMTKNLDKLITFAAPLGVDYSFLIPIS